MADLSHTDKLILLGADYESAAKQRQYESGITDAMQGNMETAEKLSGIVSGGVYFIVVGALILLSNYYALSGPYNERLTLVAAAMVVAGAAVAAWASKRRAQILGRG